jgi:hypothetical protein
MAKILPTVGRNLLYFHAAAEHDQMHAAPPPGQPLMAFLAGVQSDEVVNLMVLDYHGVPFSRVGVPLVQEGEPKPEGAFAAWMEYQIGQAAKTEALQAQAGLVIVQTAPQPVAAAAAADPAPQPEPAPLPEPAPAAQGAPAAS